MITATIHFAVRTPSDSSRNTASSCFWINVPQKIVLKLAKEIENHGDKAFVGQFSQYKPWSTEKTQQGYSVGQGFGVLIVYQSGRKRFIRNN